MNLNGTINRILRLYIYLSDFIYPCLIYYLNDQAAYIREIGTRGMYV